VTHHAEHPLPSLHCGLDLLGHRHSHIGVRFIVHGLDLDLVTEQAARAIEFRGHQPHATHDRLATVGLEP